MSGRLHARIVAAVVLLVPLPAFAQAEPIAIHYETNGACPTEEAFLSKVRTYTTRWALVPAETPAARTIRVRLSDVSGSLVVKSPSGESSEREIGGPSCSAVSEALAIMVAVAIDPRALTTDAPPPTDDDTPPIDPEPPPRRADRVAPPPPPPVPPLPRTNLPLVSLDLRAEVTSAVVEGGLVAAALSVKLELPPAVGPSWVQKWRPAVAFGLRQSFPRERSLEGGAASFGWTAGVARVCPLQLALGAGIELSPCAELDVGRLHASANGYLESRDASVLWLDVGASVWAAMSLSSRFYVGVDAQLTRPLVRQPFVLASGASISTSPAVGFLAGVGLGVRL